VADLPATAALARSATSHRFYMHVTAILSTRKKTAAITPVNSSNLLLASQFNISGFSSVIDFSLISI
jgi:hypothetical protein